MSEDAEQDNKGLRKPDDHTISQNQENQSSRPNTQLDSTEQLELGLLQESIETLKTETIVANTEAIVANTEAIVANTETFVANTETFVVDNDTDKEKDYSESKQIQLGLFSSEKDENFEDHEKIQPASLVDPMLVDYPSNVEIAESSEQGCPSNDTFAGSSEPSCPSKIDFAVSNEQSCQSNDDIAGSSEPSDLQVTVTQESQVPIPQIGESTSHTSSNDSVKNIQTSQSFREKINKFDTSKTDDRPPEWVSTDFAGIGTVKSRVLDRAKAFENIIGKDNTVATSITDNALSRPTVTPNRPVSKDDTFATHMTDNASSGPTPNMPTDTIDREETEQATNIADNDLYRPTPTRLTEDKTEEITNIENNIEEFDKRQICINNGIESDSNVFKELQIKNNRNTDSTELYIDKRDSDNIIDKERNRLHKTVQFPMLRQCESIPNITTENDNKFKLGKLNPIYRLSLRLSQYLPHCMEIPNADSHRQYDKAGYLQKLSGRGGFPYLNQWKRRYCILTKGCLFLYEKESSKGSDKSTNVVDLKYFDHVAEAVQKETKKASNVFVVTSQDRSFFDPGRHLFAADTLTDMHEWIGKLREAVEMIRNNNRPTPKAAKGPVGLIVEPRQQHQNEKLQHQHLQQHEHQHERQHEQQHVQQSQEDTVDGRITTDHKKKEEFTLNLGEKLKRESSEIKNGGLSTPEKEELKDLVRDDLSASKRSTKKIVLKNQSFNIESKPQLESITKNRIRGPAGRRAPQIRRTMQMKQRASSMSALQHADGTPEGDAAVREENENFSGESEGESSSKVESCSLNSSQPILAYHYSSDEDSPEEGDNRMGSDRFIGMSASAVPPNTTSRSLNIEEVPHTPVKGLRVYLPHDLHAQPDGEGDSDLLEYRSLPRSLGRASARSSARDTVTYRGALDGRIISGDLRPFHRAQQHSHRDPTHREHPSYKKLQHSHREVHPSHRVTSGGLSTLTASPEMDALDNLLMKQSLHPEDAAAQEPCLSDPEGSDASTYKAPHTAHQPSATEDRELSKALERFSSTLQHLQHHTAELECRTKRIEADVNVTKLDVGTLQETTDGIQKDVKKLTETVAVVAQEALKAKRDYVSQRQETEKLQKEAAEALSESKNAQAQFEQTRSAYETTIHDLHSLISSIRSSLIVSSPEMDPRHTKKVTLAETGKSLSENDKAKIIDPDPKKSPKTATQKGGYHSFFQRPSSLIYGLASKSTNRSFNSKKTKDEKEKAEHANEEKKLQKRAGNDDKKQKSEQIFLEKNKHKKESAAAQPFDDVIKQIKTKANDKVNHIEYETEPKRKLHAGKDDVDAQTEMSKSRPKTTIGISHVTINVSPPSHNFNVQKSCSSPIVQEKFPQTKPARPNVLTLAPSSSDVNKSNSNTPSPEAHGESRGFPGSRSELNYPSETKFSTQPANISPQSTLNSVPSSLEDRSFLRTRPGVFAIAKQKSSPNIPLQRQSSAPNYPIQRQHSLGTVPEEGQLPRQASLISVPEDRPIVDQTLPLSPSPSMVSFPVSPSQSMLSFPLSPSPSGDRLDNYGERLSVRNSMELVTGPVISGSMFQETCVRKLPGPSEFQFNERPMATSSLKKTKDRKKRCTETVIV